MKETCGTSNQIWEEVDRQPGRPSSSLARKYSADPNTRPLGGVIPPIRKNGGNPTVEKTRRSSSRRARSPRCIEVATNRYVILRCEGLTEQLVEDPKQVWNEAPTTSSWKEDQQQAVAKVFEQVKDQARIINYYSEEATPVGQARPGQKVQPVSGTRPAGANTAFPAAASSQPTGRCEIEEDATKARRVLFRFPDGGRSLGGRAGGGAA